MTIRLVHNLKTFANLKYWGGGVGEKPKEYDEVPKYTHFEKQYGQIT